MAFKVQVGPAQIAIHQGQSVLLTEPDGQVNWPSNRGLYFRDTRVISAWAIYANGEPWDLLNGGAIAPHAARIVQTNRAFVSAVAHQVAVALLDYVAEMDADPKFDALVRCDLGVALDHRSLNFNGAVHRVDDTPELD